MSIADDIESTADLKQEGGLKFLVYGEPGVGKTYLIRTVNKPLVVSCESGLSSIHDIDVDFVEADSIEQVREVYKLYASGDLDKYEWLVLDSVSEIAEMALSEEKENTKDDRQAYGEMQETVIRLLRAFRVLDVNVYFSAKCRRETTDNGLLYCPSMPGNTLTTKRPVGHDFDFVFPLRIVDGEDGQNRVLQTEADGQFQAKARDPEHKLDKFEEADLGSIVDKLTQ